MKKMSRKDINKSESLLKMAKITLERLDSFDKLKYPSNTVNDYYDVLHKLFESYSSLKGVKFVGDNAHKELIDFLCVELFNEQDKIFLQNLRQFRNQISYEGFNIDEDFLERNDKRIRDYINYLIKLLEKGL